MIAEALDKLVEEYNNPDFITNDPICVPHTYSRRQDVEIAGFVAAIFAWGQRKTIINKAEEFLGRMDNSPYDFVKNFDPKELKVFQSFRHRTFNGDDAMSVLYFFQYVYQKYESLEVFFKNKQKHVVFEGLKEMDQVFRSLPSTLKRSHKHIASPARNSACKRLNMFMRWMVRKDDKGVDFGLWQQISPSELIIPMDVHVVRSAQTLRLLGSDKVNWRTAIELTEKLREFDAHDPIKYDFALFNYSLMQSGR